MPKTPTILIAGGGIAGLTAALTLAAKGIPVQVHEQSPEFSPVGAGIQLSPNALRVFHGLGLERRIKAISHAPDGIVLKDAKSARQLARVPLGATAIAKYGLPYLVIHRADLCSVLAGECEENPLIELRTGSKIVDAVPHANGITIETLFGATPGQSVGKCLIAADGVWSSFRTDYLDLRPARFSGEVAWRGLLPASLIHEDLLSDTHLWLAGEGHGVTYPVRGRRFLNVVIALKDKSHEKDWAEPGNIDALKERTASWSEAFKSLLEIESNWTKWPLYVSPPQSSWHGKNVLLIGDAAHAMLPYAAQGAAQAIEDAAVLADAFEKHTDVDQAFLAFEVARKQRVHKVSKLVNANRNAYHMGPMTAWARNLVLGMKSPESLLSRQDWLYGWRADRPAK